MDLPHRLPAADQAVEMGHTFSRCHGEKLTAHAAAWPFRRRGPGIARPDRGQNGGRKRRDRPGHAGRDQQQRRKGRRPITAVLIDSQQQHKPDSNDERPDGKRKAEFSLAPCAKRLSELLKKPVAMASDCGV